MTITEKTAYLRGLADGLGIAPDSKEGKLWAALSEVLGDIARELERLREADESQAQALDGMADELNYLEELCGAFEPEDAEGAEDEDPEYDGVIYDATCPVCGQEISFDEETLEAGSIQCPNCGELLEFDLGGEEEKTKAEAEKS